MTNKTDLTPHYRQSLFSNNYLQHHLPMTSFWKNNDEKIETAFKEIELSYKNLTGLNLGPGEEANLEDKLIRPILTALGYAWDVQPRLQRGPKKKRPDYALFMDRTQYTEARKHKDDLKRFFSQALTILEVKYWGRRLNDTDNKDSLDARDPTAQTVKYLDDVYHASSSRIQWAMLTNGKEWRLFYYHATSRAGNFYDINLEKIIRQSDFIAFKYFYLFFSKDAFILDSHTNKSWLDQHLKRSEAYATRVSEKLKDLIFDQIFEGLATGFVEYRRNELKIENEGEETLKEIFNACLTLLFRLLFLLYAESRNLLPIEEQNRYYKKSLKKIKEDIVKDLRTSSLEGMSHRAYDYWSRLDSLCRIVDRGDQALNIPIYNGGLFQSTPQSLLVTHKLADPYLAKAIELLTVDQDGEQTAESIAFIDYSSLGVRHLGDIYEGLLEFHVRVAEESIIEVREKGKSIWKVKKDLAKDKNTGTKRVKHPGEVYIENIKHERRATGSYYTPHYIVEFMIRNTVGPILETRHKRAESILSTLENLYRKQQGKHSLSEEITKMESELFQTLFDMKILDPAMGSGHFLVHTVDFIADKIITFLARYPNNSVIAKIEDMKQQILENVAKQKVKIDEERLTEVNLIKRMVMKKCIYGVDINEMAVELAKLSLWLDSFTLGAPLSFLDHHLKCGDSLVGTEISEAKKTLEKTLFGFQVKDLLSATALMCQVGELTDTTLEDIKKSVTLFNKADEELKPAKLILDFLVSEHFGNIGAQKFLTQGGDVEDLLRNKKLDKEGKKLALKFEELRKEKRFFHWEAEFPEVFYDETTEKECPGFDAVIGNPPYVSVTNIEADLRKYLPKRYKTATGRFDLYIVFTELALSLLRENGMFSFIEPIKFTVYANGRNLREVLLESTQIEQIVDISQCRVFPDPTTYPCVQIVKKCIPASGHLVAAIHVPPSMPESISRPETGVYKTTMIPQSRFFELPENIICLRLSDELWELIARIKTRSLLLGDIFDIEQCIRIGSEAKRKELVLDQDRYLSSSSSVRDNCKKMLDGENVDRYFIDWGKVWLHYKPDELYNAKSLSVLECRKILIKRIAPTLTAVPDFGNSDGFYYPLNTIYALIPKLNLDFSFYYVTALLNSKFLDWYYKQLFESIAIRGGYIEYREQLKYLPIVRIAFTTDKATREHWMGEIASLYRESNSNLLKIRTMAQIELSSEGKDYIHDLLAFLAEQMGLMHTQMQEIGSIFIRWLEKEIVKEPIHSLKNKAKIKEFLYYPLDSTLEVLKENNCIPTPVPSRILNQIEEEYRNIMVNLNPLKERISATDQLINQLIYELYGLSDNEIMIIEETLDPNVNSS